MLDELFGLLVQLFYNQLPNSQTPPNPEECRPTEVRSLDAGLD